MRNFLKENFAYVRKNMEEKELFKKLEKIELPEIEIPTHRERLKNVLITEFLHKKERKSVFSIYKRILAPVGVLTTVLLVFLVINNVLRPSYTLADTMKIIMADPRVQELVAGGAEVKDVKIVENKAYALIGQRQPVEEASLPESEMAKAGEQVSGTLAEINLKEKKVAKIEKIAMPVSPLTDTEITKVQQIIENTEILKLGKPEIKEVIPVPPFPIKLIEKDKGVEIMTEKKASVIYEIGETQWRGEVNLTQEKLESAIALPEIEE